MAIDFTFTKEQQELQASARDFAQNVLAPLTPKIDFVTEVLVPTIWITRDQMLLSMDLAAELLFRL